MEIPMKSSLSNDQRPIIAMTENENSPEHDRIAARAFSIWMERGRPEGTEQDDWLQAEREIRETWLSSQPRAA
jgi:Uma2 family endonuclease